ncbi:VOC family protein [Acinetobacter sp. ANC 3813]|uniref:VOC family protein n=1 Tax=Acinetobacter sp. ANC 3813 TaxID=1977873 RepID=UPI000A3480BB|nr:VOC family protein [Acinetobacter sp. ANC 3813]OTG90890.1 ring-cleaving dioxygenase [Acinetobacter sp. ANC 3813]
MSTEKDFHIKGLDCLRFGVENLQDALRFANDWGLKQVQAIQDNSYLFETTDGSQVEIFQADASNPLRTPIGSPSGMCEMVWGVADQADLDAIAAELRTDREVTIDADGTVHSQDDLGIRLAFRLAQRSYIPFNDTQFNSPSQPKRVNSRAPRYEKAQPYEISHLAIGVDNAGDAVKFYLNRLGFRVSDRYADRGVFIRCSAEGNHHHLFFMNGKQPGTRFNHLAFKVRDIHEVIFGGQHIDSQGWTTFAGPGRHRVSSACFWYFLTPFGGAWEYAADEDIVTEDWESTDFAAEAHIFTEWTFGLEKSDGTLKGPISQSKAETLND